MHHIIYCNVLFIASYELLHRIFQSDITIVVDDFAASNNTELSVHRGQQVEVIDLSPGQPNWCYVRTLQSDSLEQGQGLVPTATLKPIPRLLGPGSRSSQEFEGKCIVIHIYNIYK